MISAEVILWGKRIGAVTEDNGVVRFNYDPDFVGSGIELSPITMPLNYNVYSFPELTNTKPFYGIPGMLSDSLPDGFGNYMIDKYLSAFGEGRSELSPVEKLCYMGKRGMGALEYVPSDGPKDIEDSINIKELTKLAEEVLINRENMQYKAEKQGLRMLFQVGSSAGGARAKAIIAWNEKTNDIRSGQIKLGEDYGYWILKFGDMSNNTDKEIKPDDIDSTKTEYAYYLMATDSGIDMSESRLFDDGDTSHFITRRFDRKLNGDKIHMQTLCGLTQLDFANHTNYDYSMLSRFFPYLNLGNDECVRMFRRIVFNDMAFNFDDHIKNISFLMDKDGQWKLSPAYDVTFSHDPNGRFTKTHQMRINGKNFDITMDDYFECGKSLGIKKPVMNNIIEEVRETVKNFRSYAAKAGVREEQTEYIARLIDTKI